MMSSGVSCAWPISCRMTARSRSSSSASKRRMLQDVGDDVDGQRHVLLQHLGVVGGVFARGVGVEVAADRLDLLGDGARVAPPGPLERHVLEQVRDAGRSRRLVAGAGLDPDADRGGLDPIHRVGRDPQAVGQGRDTDAHTITASQLQRLGDRRGPLHRHSLGSDEQRSGRLIRSASRAGSAGRMPVAASTASGNFAGWAVASAHHRHLCRRGAARLAAMPMAVCGSTRMPSRR